MPSLFNVLEIVFTLLGVGLLLNITANRFPDHAIRPLLKWGWFSVALYVTIRIMTIEFIQQWLRGTFRPSVFSYVIAAILGAAMAISYWAIINRIERSAESQETAKAEQTPPSVPAHVEAPSPLVTARNAPVQSSVALRFVGAKSPALVIENRSDVVARQIKWTVVLWNVDRPDRADPLPIPVATFDFIRPGRIGGPQNLFGAPAVATLLRTGDRLIGVATVDCPECDKGHTYGVYIVWGNGGWYAEAEGMDGRLLLPQRNSIEEREKYFQVLNEMFPEKSRIPITDWAR